MSKQSSIPTQLIELNQAFDSKPIYVQTTMTIRTRLGEQLNHNKTAILGSIVFVLLINRVVGFISPNLNALGTPLAMLAILTLSWLKKSGWSDIGFMQPKSWWKTAALGVGVAVSLQASALLITLPLLARLGIPTPDLSAYGTVKSNAFVLIGWLLVSWTTAGFGEEIIWRGFMMPQIARLFNNNWMGWVLGLLGSSVLFGLIHYPQGITGMVMTGFSGIIYGLLVLTSGHKLWPAIIAHGMTDTIAFLLLCYGGSIIQAVGL